ncbi:hypothetical protein LCGC14_2795370 [marine sediment metagenome]|uniref:Uncharacterized protein n=1 Tax=marine sediment metagenome TaxID=412755 RepID=A0A0F8ZBC2_9ZZZZ
MKIIAPYPRFRYKHMYFPLGFRYCSDEEIKQLKKVPLSIGELKKVDGTVLNKPKPAPKNKQKKQSKK